MWKQKFWTLAMSLTLVMGTEKAVAGDDAPQSFASKRRLFEQKAQGTVNPPIVRRGQPKAPVIPEPTPEVKAKPTPEEKTEPTPKPAPTGVPKVAGPSGTAITPDIISEEAPEVIPETADSKKTSGWRKGATPKTTGKNIKTTARAKTEVTPEPTTGSKESAHDCSKCSEEDCKTNKGRYEFCKLCYDVNVDKCLKGASDAGFINKATDFKQANALSEGKGIKAKDVLPRFNSIETIMKDLHSRISRLKSNKKVFSKKETSLLESIDFIKEKTGLKDANINPEQELKNYDAVLMTSISGGIGGLSVEICEALVTDFDRKVESNFKSLISKTQRFVNSQTKHKQEDKLKQLKEAGSKMSEGCKGWKLATQVANQEKKDVYGVLQSLWKEMDGQLQAAQTLLASKN